MHISVDSANIIHYTEYRSNFNIAEWSSLVARRAHNPKVGGSNPPSATTNVKAQLSQDSWAFTFQPY